MLPILQREFVRNCWMTDNECMDVISLTTSLPGPIVVNGATFMGYKLKGIPGAFAAVAGAILPSIVIITIIASVFSTITGNQYVDYFFAGVRPGVCALLLYTMVRLSAVVKLRKWQNAALALATFVAVGVLGVHQIFAILASAAIGILAYSKNRAPKEGDEDGPFS